MIKPPKDPVGPAFEAAREWESEQERRLTDEQRRGYDGLKKKQARQRQQEQERLDAFKRELEEKAKRRSLKAELALNPPIRSADPHVRRLAQNAIAAEQRLEQLDRAHVAERIKTLRAYEQERERHKSMPTKSLGGSWLDAVNKTVQQERAREERERDLGRDFDETR